MMGRRKVLLQAMFGAIGMLYAAPAPAIEIADPTQVVRLDGIWLFHPGDNPTFARPRIDDFSWFERNVPTAGNYWSDRWNGSGWYRLHFSLSETALHTDLAAQKYFAAQNLTQIPVTATTAKTRFKFSAGRNTS